MNKFKKSNIVPTVVIVILVLVVILQYAAYHSSNSNSTTGLMQYLSNLDRSFMNEPIATSTAPTTMTGSTAVTAPATAADGTTSAYPKPVIYSISPATGTTGLTITIKGSGFDFATNDISFGPSDNLHSLNGLSANVISTEASGDGRTLKFNVPVDEPSGLLCDASGKNCNDVEPVLYPAGSYPITVTSRGGVSNTIWFSLTH